MRESRDSRLGSVVTSFPAVASLALLLANDWYFKAAFGNGLTGKLSDFAGLFLLALLAFAAVPRHKGLVAVGIGLAFAWWKSPLSQPLIDAVQWTGVTRFGRVVDYTDLVALVMVPVAWAVVERLVRFRWHPTFLRRALYLPLLVLSVGSMIATTASSQASNFDVQQEDKTKELDRQRVSAAIRQVADQFGLACLDCSEPDKTAAYWNADGGTTLDYVILTDGTIRFSVSVRHTKLILPDGTSRRIGELEDALREALEASAGSLTLRNHIGPPSPSQQQIAPLFPVFTTLFKQVALEHQLVPVSEGGVDFESADGTLYFGFSYRTQDTIRLEVWGGSDKDVSAITSALMKALDEKITGYERYSEESIYFGAATLRESS